MLFTRPPTKSVPGYPLWILLLSALTVYSACGQRFAPQPTLSERRLPSTRSPRSYPPCWDLRLVKGLLFGSDRSPESAYELSSAAFSKAAGQSSTFIRQRLAAAQQYRERVFYHPEFPNLSLLPPAGPPSSRQLPPTMHSSPETKSTASPSCGASEFQSGKTQSQIWCCCVQSSCFDETTGR